MRVEGANLGSYQPQHIPVVQRETPHSVKPNVFQEIEVEQDANAVARSLFGRDLVLLSPEARELLNIIRKRMAAGLPANLEDLEASAPERLIYTLQELRRKLEDESDHNDPRRRSRGLKQMPPSFTFQLSGPAVPPVDGELPRPKPRRSEAAALVSRMIVHSPSEETSQALMQELEVLGETMIEYVRSFGVKIILLERHQTVGAVKIAGMYLVGRGEKTMDGRDWNVVRGLYDNGRKLIVMGEERIGRRSHSTPLHEFAHAYDHAFSERNHRIMPLSVQLWNSFAPTRKGLITAYAGTNPAEYFAESAEAWFAGGMRERLANLDPQMYTWLENLFAA
ncbi:MAG: anthrax toxin lethal factor-related metalloendopeptidase [Candidatus Xenobia bacterium]